MHFCQTDTEAGLHEYARRESHRRSMGNNVPHLAQVMYHRCILCWDIDERNSPLVVRFA